MEQPPASPRGHQSGQQQQYLKDAQVNADLQLHCCSNFRQLMVYCDHDAAIIIIKMPRTQHVQAMLTSPISLVL